MINLIIMIFILQIDISIFNFIYNDMDISRYNIWLFLVCEMLNIANFETKLDYLFQRILSFQINHFMFVLLEVDS